MYLLGMNGRGPVLIERLTELPKFNSKTDIGRLVIIENDKPYIGNINKWEQIIIKGICVFLDNISFGFESNSVDGSNIPIKYKKVETNIQNVADIIEKDLKSIKEGTYFNNSVIQPKSLNLNPSQNGLMATHIKVRDLNSNFNNEQNHLTIEQCLEGLIKRKGTDIKFGGSLVYKTITLTDSMSIFEAFETFFNTFTADLQANLINCKYYEFDPTGKSHCVDSNLQFAMDNLSNHLQNHKIIDHLDVQHDWGHCGQYLGTYGENLDPNGNCCDGPHLPLKFKTIQADEVKATVSDIDLGLGTTTTVQKYLTQLVREIQEIRNNLLTWTDVNGPGHHRTPNIPGSKWVYSVHLMQLSSDGYSNTGNYIGHASGICGPNALIVYQSGYFAEGFYMRVL